MSATHYRPSHNMMAATLAMAIGAAAGPVAEPVNPFPELDLGPRRTGWARPQVEPNPAKAKAAKARKDKRKAAKKSRAKNRRK